jgi:A/G-specific adenine glycosylase
LTFELKKGLLRWFSEHQREMPWRKTRDPYAIWVSEIMLQQTQVATVIPYFQRFISEFPDVYSLAYAPTERVMSLWQGLGYYRRARMLQDGAVYITGAGMPSSAAEWLKVPGVGRYTAGAIASIALGEPVPIVDGNVERIFARFCNDSSTKPSLTAQAWTWTESVLDRENPGDWNQALMELGATICTPRSPRCEICPLQSECSAHANGTVSERPVPLPKRKPVQMERTILVVMRGSEVAVRLAESGEWWTGMMVFPQSEGKPKRPIGKFLHTVTHHRIQFYVVLELVDDPNAPAPEGFTWRDASDRGLALPKPFRKALEIALDDLLDG